MPRQLSNLKDNFISTEVDFRELDFNLSRYEKKIQETVLFSGVARMARVIYDEVRLNAEKNKKTGLLQSAIYRMYLPEKSDETKKTYIVSVNKGKAPHWHFLEYGTYKQPAYPFIRPAFDRMPDAVREGRNRMADKLAEGGVGGLDPNDLKHR